MRFYSGLVSGFVFASTVLAQSVEHSQPFARDSGDSGENYVTYQAGVSSSNVTSTYRFITAIVTLPQLSAHIGSAVNMYVGIDGDVSSCLNVSLRAGILGQVDDAGSTVYSAYLMWYPADKEIFRDFIASPGDQIVLSVSALKPGSGVVAFWNSNTGQFASEKLESSNSLCRVGVMWFVEPDYNRTTGAFYRLAGFTTISFEGAFAIINDQIAHPTKNSEITNIMTSDKQVLTTVEVRDAGVDVSILY